MKRLILLLFLAISGYLIAQDIKPINPEFKMLQTPNNAVFWYNPVDSFVWIYKGAYGWTRLLGETRAAYKYVPYKYATKDVDLGNRKISSTKQRLPLFNGACQIPTILDNGDGSISVGDGEYHVSTNVEGRGSENFAITGGTFTLTNNTTNYLVADYNSGTPVLRVTTDVNEINETTIVPVYTAYRSGNSLHFQNWDALGVALANKVHQSIVKTQRYRRESGLALSEYPTRYLALSSGRVWVGAVPVSVDAIATSTDNIYLFYHSGGVWTSTVTTQYNNTQYDNGTNLVTLTANRYAVNWIFRGIESQKHLYVILGTGDYTLAQAQEAVLPAAPTAITSHSMLVGKLIVQRDATTATAIQSAFDTQFSSATPNAHNDLTGRDATDVHPASSVTNTPAGTITATTVQASINYLDGKDVNTVSITGTDTKTITVTLNNGSTKTATFTSGGTTLPAGTGYLYNDGSNNYSYSIPELSSLLATGVPANQIPYANGSNGINFSALKTINSTSLLGSGNFTLADVGIINTFTTNQNISAASPYLNIINTNGSSAGSGVKFWNESTQERLNIGYNNSTDEAYIYGAFNDPLKVILNGVEQSRFKTDGVFETRNLSSPPSASRSGFGGFFTYNNLPYFINSSGTTYDLSAGGGGSMVYPSGSGLAVVNTGTSWGTTISIPGNTTTFLRGDGTFATPTFSSQWTTDTYGINYSSNVGIGASSLQYNKLYATQNVSLNYSGYIANTNATGFGLLVQTGATGTNPVFTSQTSGINDIFRANADGSIKMSSIPNTSQSYVLGYNPSTGYISYFTTPSGGGGSGTVTSVGMQMENVLYNSTVTGSPVTVSGTLQPTLKTQSGNLVFASPIGGGTPTFRKVVVGDISATGTPSSSTFLRGDGTWSTPASSTNYWTYSAPNLYPNNLTDNLALGTADAGAYKLKVVGNSRVEGQLSVNWTAGGSAYSVFVNSNSALAAGFFDNSSTGRGIYVRAFSNIPAVLEVTNPTIDNTIETILELRRMNNGSPGTGAGAGILFTHEIQGVTDPVKFATIASKSTDVTASSEDGSLIFSTVKDGTVSQKMSLDNDGRVVVNSSVDVGDDSASASSNNVGAIRYRVSGNNSYCEMVMQTGASTYAWVIIKQNSW